MIDVKISHVGPSSLAKKRDTIGNEGIEVDMSIISIDLQIYRSISI